MIPFQMGTEFLKEYPNTRLNWFVVFLGLCHIHFNGSIGIKIKIKGKTGQKLHENANCLRKIVHFFKNNLVSRIYPDFFLIINVQEDMRNSKSIESGVTMFNMGTWHITWRRCLPWKFSYKNHMVISSFFPHPIYISSPF